MTIPAPYERFAGEVLPEWIDYNGHMNLAYYTVLFDYATDLLFDELGLGLDYRRATRLGTFVAETHNRYERELLVGARVRVATQIIATDAKRL
jgi:acyl-CoA thioester hydrolase